MANTIFNFFSLPIQKSLKFKAINLKSKLINPNFLLINNTIPLSRIKIMEYFIQHKTQKYFSTKSIIKAPIIPKDYEKVSPNLNTNTLLYDIIDNSVFKNMKLLTDSSSIKTFLDCNNFYLEKERIKFRRQLSKISGIYMLKCKLDSRLFYIGQSLDLATRFASHFNRTEHESSKLGNILNYLGWENFSVHILEYCNEEDLIQRENYYIEKYLPSLNGKFSSYYSKKIHRNLRSILKYIQEKTRKDTNDIFIKESIKNISEGYLNNKY
jgi:hypothetical protein